MKAPYLGSSPSQRCTDARMKVQYFLGVVEQEVLRDGGGQWLSLLTHS